MLQPGRSYAAGSGYRYGFNGKENDNEVKGEGNQQDYGMRFYDPRLGKFLSVDPISKDFPFYSPYHYAGNTPIWALDLDGREPLPYCEWKFGGWSSIDNFKKIQGSKSHVKVINFGDIFDDGHNYVAIRDQKIPGKWWYASYEDQVGSLGNSQKGNWKLNEPGTNKYNHWTPEGWQADDQEIKETARHLGAFGRAMEKVIINGVIFGVTGGIGSGSSLTARFIYTRTGTTLGDIMSQYASGKSTTELNLTSITLSATTGIPASVTSFGSSAYEYSIKDGFGNSWSVLGLGGDKSTKQVIIETSVGSFTGMLNGKANSNIGVGSGNLYRDLRYSFNPSGAKFGMTVLPGVTSFGTNFLSNTIGASINEAEQSDEANEHQ
jgi:RHS repeat-associated protein